MGDEVERERSQPARQVCLGLTPGQSRRCRRPFWYVPHLGGLWCGLIQGGCWPGQEGVGPSGPSCGRRLAATCWSFGEERREI